MWCKEKKKRYGSIWGKCLLQGSAHSWQVNEIYQNKICLKKKKGAYTTERRKMEKYWGSPRGIPFLYMGGKLLDNLKVKRSRGCVLSDDILVISSSWMPHLFFFFLRNGRANQSATWIGGGRRKFPVDLVYKGNCLSSILSTVKIDLLGPSAKTIDVYTVDILVFRQTIKRRRDETKGSTAGQTVSFSPPEAKKLGTLALLFNLRTK